MPTIPDLHLSPVQDGLNLYSLSIDRQLNRDEFRELTRYVSANKCELILRLRKYEDQQRSLLGNTMARYGICRRMHILNEDLVFGTNRYNKPLLLQPAEIHFNISHSGDWVVCALDINPVGVDVEGISSIDYDLAKRFFSKEEYVQLMNQPEDSRLKYFFMLWTLKESYMKATGKGLHMPLDSFTILLDDDRIVARRGNTTEVCCFHLFDLDIDTIFSVCSRNSRISNHFQFKIDDFLETITSIQYAKNYLSLES